MVCEGKQSISKVCYVITRPKTTILVANYPVHSIKSTKLHKEAVKHKRPPLIFHYNPATPPRFINLVKISPCVPVVDNL